MQAASSPSADDGQELTELSRAIVRLYKQRLGHGPTRARAYRASSDILLCVMEGTLTTKERTLHEAGADQGLLESRTEVQEILKDEIGAQVERALGRRVRSVVGGLDPDSDVATQTFLLEPDASN
jgi:uncharacterized protein YbcI